MKAVKYLFVGGGQRTGTTMLQSILCQSQLTNEMIGEASYFRGLVQAYQLGKMSFSNETEDYFFSDSEYLKFHSQLILQFLELQFAMRPNMKCLVLKEPHLTKEFSSIFELVPEASFLMIMRDPRDAIASMVKVGEKMRQRGEQHFFQARDMKQLSEYFLSFYLPTMNSSNLTFQEHVYTIRYEDLVSSPESTIHRINEFIGFEIDKSYGDELRLGKFQSLKDADRYQPWSTDILGKSPEASSVGRYKKVLTELEVAQIEQYCQQLMSEFSYAS